MRILGIDTSTPESSVALLEDLEIRQEIVLDPPNPHSNRVLHLIDEVLTLAGVGLEAVDGFAVTRGPGSFTGLRVGMSLLEGMGLVTGKPVVGVDTLLAVAATAGDSPHPICAVLDARKKEIYTAFFRSAEGRLSRLSEDRAIAPGRFVESLGEPALFVGYGLAVYGEFFARHLGSRYLTAPGGRPSVAACAARIAGERLARVGAEGLGEEKNIHYLRKSEAEIQYSTKQA